jgi:arsenate reductase
LLRELGYEVSSLRSKSWDEFALPSAPQLDFVFSVCDNAAGEACPVWPGQPITAHWGIEDPAAETGDEASRRRAFRKAYAELEERIQSFTSLPLEPLDRASLLSQLREIGETQGSRPTLDSHSR